MHIYRTGPDQTFGALDLMPQHFYKFWDGDVDASEVGSFRKPLDPMPEIDWEIDLTADDWRQRISLADPDNPIPIARLREIPDSYIDGIFLNMIYGYPMMYRTYRAVHMQVRIAETFCVDPIVYPAYAMAMLGIKTLIEELAGENDTVSLAKTAALRQLLRHITYVAVVIVRDNQPLEPTGKVLVSSLVSKVNNGSDYLFYDDAAWDAWIAAGGTEALAAAEWVLNQRNPDHETITNKKELLERWAVITDLTKP
jgi:hypothetical protein